MNPRAGIAAAIALVSATAPAALAGNGGGHAWSIRSTWIAPVSAPVSSDETNCPDAYPNTTQLAVNPVDHSLAVYYTGGNQAWPVVARSGDGGRTWARTTLPTSTCGGNSAPGGIADPYLAYSSDGRALLATTSWISSGPPTDLDHNAARDYASWSPDAGHTFRSTVDLEPSIGAQRGQVAADPSDRRALLVSYERFHIVNAGLPVLAGSSVALRRTTDGDTYVTLPDPYDAPVGTAVVTLGVAGTAPHHLIVTFAQVDAAGLATIETTGIVETLYAVTSSDDGAHWSPPTQVGTYTLPPANNDPNATNAGVVAGCCIPDFTVGDDGTAYLVWADPGAHSLTLATLPAGDATWRTESVAVPGGKVMVPAVAVTGQGTVGIFYDAVTGPAGAQSLTPTVLVRRSGTWKSAAIGAPFDGSTYEGSWDGTTLGPYQDIRAIGESFAVVPVLGDAQVWFGRVWVSD